jgi:hypothetical protein
MRSFIGSRRGFLLGSAAFVSLPTGLPAQISPREGGIGGTGIVGEVTELETLLVAGNRVTIDAETRITDGFGTVAQSSLSLGDSLTIEASGPQDALVAARLHVTHPLVGAIESVSSDGRVLRINGTQVVLERRLRSFGTGDRVAVSGLWRGASVVAGHLAPARSDMDLIAGHIWRQSAFSTPMIGTNALQGRGTTALKSWRFATVTGRFSAARNRFLADRTVPERFVGSAGPLRRLSIEGYLEPSPTAPWFIVSGLGHSFDRNLNLDAFAGTRAVFNGGYFGKFRPQSAIELPEDAGARARLLRRLSAA